MAVFLGAVQGLTEFLPVSSSGHLVLLQKLMGLGDEVIGVTVVLHIGTLASLAVFFFKDIIAAMRDVRTLMLIAAVTIITGVVGMTGKHFFEQLFLSTTAVGIGWCITGVVLWYAGRRPASRRDLVDIIDAAAMGAAQAVAIAPGVSRSGLTIASLILRKLNRVTAFKFSFIAGIPAILAAAMLEMREVGNAVSAAPMAMAAGCAVSFVTGLTALWVLRRATLSARLHYFGIYCGVLGIITLLFIR
jgi:undecaprenyl-diphosphatase